MRTLTVIFLLAAVVCFALAVIGVEQRRVRLVAFGLLCFVLVPLIAAFQRVS
jgi:hypothetical protein